MNNFEKNFTPYTLYFTLFYYLCTIIHSSQFDPLSLQLVGLPEQELSPRGGSLPWDGEGWGHS